jgi:hypothetical protein
MAQSVGIVCMRMCVVCFSIDTLCSQTTLSLRASSPHAHKNVLDHSNITRHYVRHWTLRAACYPPHICVPTDDGGTNGGTVGGPDRDKVCRCGLVSSQSLA